MMKIPLPTSDSPKKSYHPDYSEVPVRYKNRNKPKPTVTVIIVVRASSKRKFFALDRIDNAVDHVSELR